MAVIGCFATRIEGTRLETKTANGCFGVFFLVASFRAFPCAEVLGTSLLFFNGFPFLSRKTLFSRIG
jgi:hypothetical protein